MNKININYGALYSAIVTTAFTGALIHIAPQFTPVIVAASGVALAYHNHPTTLTEYADDTVQAAEAINQELPYGYKPYVEAAIEDVKESIPLISEWKSPLAPK